MSLTSCDQDQNGEVFPANWREAGRLSGVTLSETEFAAVDGQSEQIVPNARLSITAEILHARVVWEGA